MNAAVLDTSVLIGFLERGGAVADALRPFDKLLVPAAVDAEFRAGLDPNTRAGRERVALMDRFLEDPSVEFLPAGRPESLKYAQIFRYLKERGTPIPLHDIWIGAAALVRDVPLATFDAHFSSIPLLRLVDCSV